MSSMIFGCGCAARSSARTSFLLMPSRAATSLTNAAISGRLRSKAAAGGRLREGRGAHEYGK